MELSEMTLKDVNDRLTALDTEVRSFTVAADVDKATAEKRLLVERKAELEDLEQRKQTALDITAGKKEVVRPFEARKDEKKMDVLNDREKIIASPEYRNVFMRHLMGLPISVEERTTYFDSTVAAGGYAVPTETVNQIFDIMVKVAPMINEITLFRGSPYVKLPKENARADAAIHTENAADTPASDSLTYLTLSGYEITKVQRVSMTMNIRAIPAFEAWLVKALGEDIGRQVENNIINGNGSGAPDGVLYAPGSWDGTNSVDYGTGLTFEHLTSGIALLAARYDARAKFLMKKSIFWNQIVNLKNAVGDPLVARDVTGTPQPRLLGYPVLISDYAPANTIFLGDFTKMIGSMPQDVNVARSEHSAFTSNAIDYRGSCIFDCGAVATDAFIKFYT